MGKLQLQCGSRSFLYKRFSWLNNQLELIDVHLLYVAGPQLAVTHPDVKILAQDDNKELTLHYAKAMFTDPEVSKFVAGVLRILLDHIFTFYVRKIVSCSLQVLDCIGTQAIGLMKLSLCPRCTLTNCS